MKSNLRQALLSPRSIAIIGQSNDATKTAGRPLKYLRATGFPGTIYPINSRRESVLGERAWSSLGALPEVPDHAYILTPTEDAIEAVEQCGTVGVPVATILADGFAAADEVGRARTAQLRNICARTGIRLVGPSSLGVVNLRDRMFLTANAAFAETGLPVGRIFAASHSGSMIGALASRGKARGIGFAGLVSIGNEVDLSIGEVCAATLDDPDIDGYLLFLETMRNADALRRFALEAAQRGKPIVAYKLGRSAAARELAVSHTGALAGEDDAASALFADCGISEVETLEALLESLPLVRRVPLRPAGSRGPRVGVVTTTGGGASMVIDRLGVAGITVEGPSTETLRRLATGGIEMAPGRLVDLTIAGARYEVMKAALDVLLTAPEFDLILAVVGSSARFHPELAVQPIVDSAGAAKPLAVSLVPEAPEALALLGAAGVANFRTPEACADAIAAAFRRRTPKPIVSRRSDNGADRLLNEAEAGVVLDRLGIPRAPAVVLDADIARTPDLPFGYPVVVKILSADIAHKSDVGGVALNIRDGETLLVAIARMRQTIGVDRVLVQPMISGIGEALVGYRVDRDVGPLVMAAAGGVHTEIYRDRSLRLAPVDLAEARQMIAEVRMFKTLAGYRGKPAGDIEALARAIVAMSQLAMIDEVAVAEAEVNPLIVQVDGVVAVDALVKLM
jgi:acyl-CoA synthetase (NDP forming)